MHGLFFVLGITVFFLGLTIVVACREKRLVWPYGPPEQAPRCADTAGYGYSRVAEATQYGLLCLGWSPDVRGKQYQTSYAMLLSPDRMYLAVVGTGTIIGIPLNSTWICSRTSDDRLCYSTDHQNGVEVDLTGTVRSQLVPGASFGTLWQRHAEWLQRAGIRTQPFDIGNEFECFHRLRAARTKEMLDRGLIRYTDATKIWYSYTVLGAIRFAFVSYGVGVLRALTGGRLPRTA